MVFSGVACSPLAKKDVEAPPADNLVMAPVPAQYEIRPGEILMASLPMAAGASEVICKGVKIPLFRGKGGPFALIAETYFSKLEPYSCLVEKTVVANFSVSVKEFPSEQLNVDQKRVFLSKKDQARVQKEQIFLNGVYASSPTQPLFTEGFSLPIEADVTSIYGSRRIFNGRKQTQHLGTDFRAAVGLPIKTANAGRVVVARDLFFTGSTVTVDHGLGVFTIYGHLSKINVVEGEYVPKGTVIGLSGKSGRVTGPHLHWGVKVNGQFIEGESLVWATKEFREE
jgi:murein DD-endopeptidase MepM/ murein hydrolase activator NlpD